MPILGTETPRSAHWLGVGLTNARRVAKLDLHGQGIGSGFLLDGALVSERIAHLPLLLTCDHVLEPFGGHNPLEATVVFEGMLTDKTAAVATKIDTVILRSPPEKLDYALALLDRWPGEVSPSFLAPLLPTKGEKVFVFSYPEDRGLALSLADNEVLDEPQRAPFRGRFFYRAPTAGGSSGGPVFNEKWELVALHEGGSMHDFYANYGVPLQPIVEDLRKELDGSLILQDLQKRVLPRRVSEPISEPDYFSVFISYSHVDATFARRLHHALTEHGVRTWLDEKQLLPGDDIYEGVERGIRDWDKILLCGSRSSLQSWWVDSEIDRAFQKERELFSKRKRKVNALVPLMLDDFMLSAWSSGKAQEVRSRIAADFRGWEDQCKFDQRFDTLLVSLRADSSGREAAPNSKL